MTKHHASIAKLSHLQDGPTVARPTYRLLQVLRAVAALMVVVHHGTILLHDRVHLPWGNWTCGGSGVDIFFVISGFVMTISSAPLRDPKRPAAHPARTFLARRLERIVPMYWIVTTVKVLTLLAAPAIAAHDLGTPWHVVASYLFLFSRSPGGGFDPVLVVGWSLNYEMLFYLIFTVVLATRASLIEILTPLLLLLAVMPWVPQPPSLISFFFYEGTMVLEFLFGVYIAYLLLKVKRTPLALAALLGAAGFALLCIWGAPISSPWRGFTWGIPAAAVVWATLALEAHFGHRAPRWALELGDASYSIYLTHGLALPVCALVLLHSGIHTGTAYYSTLAGLTVVCALVGDAVYRLIERPIAQWFKGRRRTAIPANA